MNHSICPSSRFAQIPGSSIHHPSIIHPSAVEIISSNFDDAQNIKQSQNTASVLRPCIIICDLNLTTMRSYLLLHPVLLIVASLPFWLPSTTSSFVLSSSSIRPQRFSLAANGDDSSYLATCIPGLAHVLADELAEIHPEITDITLSGNAAVTFAATREASLHALCWVRTAHRLLELVATSDQGPLLNNRDDLHEFIGKEVNIKELLGDGKGGLLTLSVKAVLNNPRQLPQDLSHSHYTALSIKNAICDVIRDTRGDRPNVDIDNPDVPLVAVLLGMYNGDGASISLYRSLHPPGSLHKRGYRQGSVIHKAAMKESLAAGLLREAGWHTKLKAGKEGDERFSKLRLIDPMAGSGSFILEAAMMAADISPALMRIRCGVPNQSLPPVTRWRSDIDTTQLWKQVLLGASKRAKNGMQWIREDPSKIRLIANDIHPGALEIMQSSLDSAGLLNLVRITNKDCHDLEIDKADGDTIPYFVVVNPPWGLRLTDDVAESWEGLRHFLRDVCPENTEAWVLSGHKAATATLKLKRDRMVPLQTGDQHLRWIQYTIGGIKSQQQQPQRERAEYNAQRAEAKTSFTVKPTTRKKDPVVRTKTKSVRTGRNEWLVD
jgi:23S rRNA G2445 N2-methylase RlmL